MNANKLALLLICLFSTSMISANVIFKKLMNMHLPGWLLLFFSFAIEFACYYYFLNKSWSRTLAATTAMNAVSGMGAFGIFKLFLQGSTASQ